MNMTMVYIVTTETVITAFVSRVQAQEFAKRVSGKLWATCLIDETAEAQEYMDAKASVVLERRANEQAMREAARDNALANAGKRRVR